MTNQTVESSEKIKERVTKVRSIQTERRILNNQISMKKIKAVCNLNNKAQNFIKEVTEKKHISPRGYLSILKVSRTIADIENASQVKKEHIAEAVQYRSDFVYQ